MDADYADNIALLSNTPTQSKSLLHSPEQAAGGIDLYMNAKKTEYMYFKREGAIATLNDSHLKSVDIFTHLERSVSSIESDVNMRLGKAWIVIDRLSIKWKSDQPDKIKRDFFCYIIKVMINCINHFSLIIFYYSVW